MKIFIFVFFLMISKAQAADEINPYLQEDANVIEKIMEVMVAKAQEKSLQNLDSDEPILRRRFEEGALRLAKSKAWMARTNSKVFAQYPELIVIDPILRLIRMGTLYPILVATGHALWIPLAAFVPDIELIDVGYFSLRNWIKKRKFKGAYGADQKDLEGLKKAILDLPEISLAQLERSIDDPAVLRSLLGDSSNEIEYKTLLSYWQDRKMFEYANQDLRPEQKMVLAIENLVMRIELEASYHARSVSVRNLKSKSALRLWFYLWGQRRDLYKRVRDLKDFQWRWLSAINNNTATQNLDEEFSALRNASLTALSNYGDTAEYLRLGLVPVLSCKKLFSEGE